MKIRHLSAIAAVLAAGSAAALPEVTSVTMSQPENSRTVTITYTMLEAPAVVTLDIETNCTASGTWASIGGAAVCNAKGAVWRKVTEADKKDGVYTITWRPDRSWPGHKIADGGARAVVTAWPLDGTPDYMAVDISRAARPDTQRYYQSADFVPGGVSAAIYKTTMLLMRKIKAAGIVWTMGATTDESGSDRSREATHQVELDDDYYIAVYETTQAQWSGVAVDSTRKAKYTAEGAMRPMEYICFNEIRTTENSHTEDTAYYYPNAPHPKSFLGLLRTMSGIDFDLPSEAQWEFAARAGNGVGYWNDGSPLKNANSDPALDRLGRYLNNNSDIENVTDGKFVFDSTVLPESGGTAIVGSYEPSDWGLYDMHGNVWEMCLDWDQSNIATSVDASGNLFAGRVNIDPSNPSSTLSGVSMTGKENRVLRGGCAFTNAKLCRSAYRDLAHAGNRQGTGRLVGFRVVCPADID